MADENRINLATLQQRDPYITEILGLAKQVHLYVYKDEWEKTTICGSLFVYKRSACPLHGVMILNKHGLNNLVEPITDQLEFQVETPFLLYRNGRAIYGIWFYKPKECSQLGALMERLRREAIEAKQKNAAPAPAPAPPPTAGAAPPPSGQKQVDILQLLSGAQQRYDSKTKTGGATEPQHISSIAPASSSNVVRPTPLKMPEASTSTLESTSTTAGGGGGGGGKAGTGGEGPSQLQALFKTVKLSQQLQQRQGGMVDEYTGDPPPDVTITPLSRSLSVSEVESRTEKPAPMRLMSTSGMTVEEIERQQREEIRRVDPSGSNAGQGLGQGQSVPQAERPRSHGADAMPAMSQSPSTQELLSMIAAAAVGDGQGSALPAMPQVPLSPAGDPGRPVVFSTDGAAGRPKPSTELLTPGDFDKSSSPSLKREGSGGSGVGTVCPDVLLTPMAFAARGPQQQPLLPTAQQPSSPVPNHAAILERLNNLTTNTAAAAPAEPSMNPELAPLTQQQFQQALVHMIRTDDAFLRRLHEAYLDSFRQLASKNSQPLQETSPEAESTCSTDLESNTDQEPVTWQPRKRRRRNRHQRRGSPRLSSMPYHLKRKLLQLLMSDDTESESSGTSSD